MCDSHCDYKLMTYTASVIDKILWDKLTTLVSDIC